MSNMNYCGFVKTLPDFEECADAIEETGLREEEHEARIALINKAADLLDSLGIEIDYNAVEEAIENLEN